ncbi:non-homologous end-joining DNA ligase [Anaeromyxobacter sp. SG66]|uniref:non-homologous end-joining DNA ligase n=1 Tax=Anaeromyxobacter sp. SG66 TaxID=2925410 RepID=UPI001F59E738|nr:non-homologous end-joining DNA ligase [Anaeromyxobacter sp. SG66]
MITHPEKVLFPDSAITKGELCAYYDAVAPLMIPHIRGRPITMERFPAGIEKKGFIQKDVSKGFPSWLERVEVEKRNGKAGESVHYPLVGDARSLVWLANQNSVTPHVWISRVPKLHQPDLCVFDLDPSAEDPQSLRTAALAVRELLDELGLPSYVKTSGSKGFHILIPLDGEADAESVWRFAHDAGAVLVKRHPHILTQEFIKADRGDRIFVDTGRNLPGATFAAVYAVRARPGAPISAPCTWAELEEGTVGPRTFTLRTMAARIGEVGELWSDMDDRRCSLRDATARLQTMLTDAERSEALAASTRRPVSRKAPRKQALKPTRSTPSKPRR